MTSQLFAVAGLLIAGYLLISIELFVVPGFGVPGISGLICLILACALALRYFGAVGGGTLVGGVILLTSVGIYFLPRMPFGRWIIQRKTLESARTEVSGLAIGDRGTTESDLRPAGIARFGQRRESVVTGGEYIDTDKTVTVVELEGLRIVVEENQGESE